MNIKIVEVGARDGLQNEKKVISTADKIEFIRLLSLSGLKTIEITSFVKADKIPQFVDAKEVFEAVKNTVDPLIALPCLVPNLRGLENAMSCGVSEISMFTSTSNTFNQRNINANIEQAHARQIEIAKVAKEKDLKIRGYLSTVFYCPYEGKVEDKAIIEGINRLFELGCYEVSLGDTIGVANPKLVKHICKLVEKEFDISKLAMHFHDTEGMAIANTSVALNEGFTTFDSSAAGLGGCPYAKGASGNLATDDLVNFLTKEGLDSGVDQEALHRASSFIIEKIGRVSSP